MRFGGLKLPDGVDWNQFFAVAVLAGIGFTMSLFIGTLAFRDIERITAVQLGVLVGSGVAAVLGVALLRFTQPAKVRG